MNIALIGGTCVGKTSVMIKLVQKLDFASRNCGGEVVAAAKLLNIPPEELSTDSHLSIDNATREFVAENSKSIIDGRFLHYVLASFEETVVVVELCADEKTRAKRAKLRLRDRDESAEGYVAASDARDFAFIQGMYPSISPLHSTLVIDTSELIIDQVASRILSEVIGKSALVD